MNPYPLRTKPFFRDYIWGGRKLETVLGKAISAEGEWAESWEFVDHAEHQSEVTNGPLASQTLHEIAKQHHDWLFGSRSIQRLPLLLKYLDCNRVLSVQVHPDDAYAQQMAPPDLGKTEAWYIVDAEPGSVLYAGLKEGVTKSDLRAAVEAGRVEETLHEIQPQAGDCLFIPAGQYTHSEQGCWWLRFNRHPTRHFDFSTGTDWEQMASRVHCMWSRHWKSSTLPLVHRTFRCQTKVRGRRSWSIATSSFSPAIWDQLRLHRLAVSTIDRATWWSGNYLGS